MSHNSNGKGNFVLLKVKLGHSLIHFSYLFILFVSYANANITCSAMCLKTSCDERIIGNATSSGSTYSEALISLVRQCQEMRSSTSSCTIVAVHSVSDWHGGLSQTYGTKVAASPVLSCRQD